MSQSRRNGAIRPCAQPRKISEYFRNRSAPLARGACASDGAPAPRGLPPGGARGPAQQALGRSPPSAPAEEPVERRCAECAKLPREGRAPRGRGRRRRRLRPVRQLGEQAGSARDNRGVPRARAAEAARGRRRAGHVRGPAAAARGRGRDPHRGRRGPPQCGEGRRRSPLGETWSRSGARRILSHKVSKLYTDQRASFRDKLVTVPRRGVAALCMAVTEKVSAPADDRRPAPPPALRGAALTLARGGRSASAARSAHAAAASAAPRRKVRRAWGTQPGSASARP